MDSKSTTYNVEKKVQPSVALKNMRNAFRSIYRKMIIYAFICISTLMSFGYVIGYFSSSVGANIYNIAYIAITPVITTISFYILNKKLLYRETLDGKFVYRHQGKLAGMDSTTNLIFTGFVSMVLPFSFVFLPFGTIFSNILGIIIVTCSKCALTLFMSMKLFQILIVRESTPQQNKFKRIPYPDEYPSGDIRNTTSVCSIGNPIHRHDIAKQNQERFKSIKWQY